MPEPFKTIVRVTKAEYIDEADSILLEGSCEHGIARHQMHSSAFSFDSFFTGKETEQEKKTIKIREMRKTAQMWIGKNTEMVFDPDLDLRIKANAALKYR